MINCVLLGLVLGALLFNYYEVLIIIFVAIIYFTIKKKYFNLICFISAVIFALIFFVIAKENIFNKPTILIVKEAHSNYIIASSFFKKYYIYIKNNDYEVYDILKVTGTTNYISMHAIESHFDFQSYLNNNGVFYEIKINSVNTIVHSFIPTNKIIKYISLKYDKETMPYILSLLFGISQDNEYSLNSFNYLLILNSLYFTTILDIIYACISKIGNKYLKSLGVILFIPYLILVINKRCVIRSLIFIFAKHIGKKLPYFLKMKYILLIYLLKSPFNIYDYGLIFSLSIRIFSYFVFTKVNKRIYSFLLISLFVMLISYLLNGTLNLTLPFIRIVLMPIIFIYYLSLLISIYFSFINLNLSFYTLTINKLCSIFKVIDFNIYFSKVFYVFVFLLILTLMYSLYLKSTRKLVITISVIFAFFITTISPINNLLCDYLYFIDVGQGDAALIVHNNKTILIDTGGLTNDDIANTSLIPFFKKVHVNKIDYVIISHDDYDHAGALSSLMSNFKVSNILKDKSDFPLIVGDIKLENLNNYYSNTKNDSSIVNKFNYLGYNWLFLGDITKNIEKDIINDNELNDVDIIKLAHHGSNTSTCEELLDATTPIEVIISVGYNNKYNFPSSKVLDRLQSRGIKIRRTDYEGTIIYKRFKI